MRRPRIADWGGTGCEQSPTVYPPPSPGVSAGTVAVIGSAGSGTGVSVGGGTGVSVGTGVGVSVGVGTGVLVGVGDGVGVAVGVLVGVGVSVGRCVRVGVGVSEVVEDDPQAPGASANTATITTAAINL